MISDNFLDLAVETAKSSPLKEEIKQQAIAVAMASNAPKKMSAILLDKRNRVISTGVNSYEITHPQQFYAAVMASKKFKNPNLRKKLYLHCEINCLIKARKPGSKLVICRVGGHGGRELRDSFCCPICYLYITTNCPTIKEIHWSTSDQKFLFTKIR
jgi:deoxycytidylate deaminase